ITGFKGQSGSNGVAGYVSQPQYVGAITYVEYSYALNSHAPVAKILNAAGFYTEPTAANVAVALLGAKINQDVNSVNYLTQQLEGVYRNPDPRTYPLSSYSYMLVPTALEYGFTENKGLTLAAFARYFLCEGQQQADVLGYSPLPINLVQAGLDQVRRIPGGDPTAVDITKCNNPTFASDGSNKLATTAPQPQACDKKGPTQCATGTGGASATVTPVSSGSNGSSGGTTDGSNPGATDDPAPGSGDGDLSTLGGSSGPATVAGSPVTLPTSSGYLPGVIAASAVGFMVVIAIFGPPLMSRRPLRGSRTTRAPGAPRPATPNVHRPSVRRPRRGRVTTAGDS
ncbi:MAG: substrate-binding domain-containing protein, partial [Microbacterium sp.]|uniref:substrate-binding domain-containing protein n=1 Tax=Microbacterium sp. TaxID=51671 RepID=UPI00261A4838